jgi:hypothetical protein
MPYVIRGKNVYRADTGKLVAKAKSKRNAAIIVRIRLKAAHGK